MFLFVKRKYVNYEMWYYHAPFICNFKNIVTLSVCVFCFRFVMIWADFSFFTFSFFSIPPGFFSADNSSEAGVRQMRATLQNPKEESQQVPILPLPEVPVSGHVPQRWVLQGGSGCFKLSCTFIALYLLTHGAERTIQWSQEPLDGHNYQKWPT